MNNETASVEQPHFMDHPEVEAYLRDLFPAITGESDRGAILLGAAQIDHQLKAFFEVLLPEGTNRKRKDEIFSFNGPFGSLSSKLDVAYTCRLLPPPLIKAIHLFRKLRNDLAHKTAPFTLNDHATEIRQIFALVGPGVEVGVSHTTVNLMLENMLTILGRLENPTEPGQPMFTDRGAVLAYISNNKHHLGKLEDQRMKWEVGIGVGLICGFIIHLRNELSATLGSDETFAFAWRRSHAKDASDA